MEDYKVLQTGDEIQEILNQAPVDTADIAELKEAATSLDGRLEAVEGKIPSGASSENPLTDKQYVDDSIASASAIFRGTYNEMTDLELTTDATHADIGSALDEVIELADSNDYCFVQIPTDDETPTEIESIERYKFVTGTGWEYEYTLNNSGFTADQWAAINSGITSGLVAKLTDLPTNAELNTLLNGKANAADVYTKSETYTKTELDTQLGAKANSADVYPKTDTYTKQEVDALITTPEVQYVTVTATSGTTSVTDVLPATGAANTIYRVGSWDGTQYDDGVYSEYSWNGSAYILLDVKNYGLATGSDFNNPTSAQRSLVTTVGSVLDGMPEGVFDVSARNSGSTWASLSALLSDADLDTLIPASWRKGGMTIRFVQTSDNKYVQFRLMGDSFNTNAANWQGVDSIPIAGSSNLVESGGVKEAIDLVDSKITGKVYGTAISAPGQNIIPVPALVVGKTYKIQVKNNGDTFSSAFYVDARNEQGTTIGSAIVSKPNGLTAGEEVVVDAYEVPANFYKFFTYSNGGSGWNIRFDVYDDSASLEKRLDAVEEDVTNIEAEVSNIDEGAFDLSKRTGVQYESLTAALTALLANTTSAERRGGMSFKFIVQKYNVAISTQASAPSGATLLASHPNVASGNYTAEELAVFTTLPTTEAVTYYISNGASTPTYVIWTITKNAVADCEYVQYRLMLPTVPSTGVFTTPRYWQGVVTRPTEKQGFFPNPNLVKADYIYQQFGKLFDIDKTYNNYVIQSPENNIIYQTCGNYGKSLRVEIINNTGQTLYCRYYYGTQYYSRNIATGTDTTVTENFDAGITVIYFYFNANVTLNGRLKIKILSNTAKDISEVDDKTVKLNLDLNGLSQQLNAEEQRLVDFKSEVYTNTLNGVTCYLNKSNTEYLYFSKTQTTIDASGGGTPKKAYRIFYSIAVKKGDKIHIKTTTTMTADIPVFNIGMSSTDTPAVGVTVSNVVELDATKLIDTYYDVLSDGYLYICAYYSFMVSGNNIPTLQAYKMIEETDNSQQYTIINRTVQSSLDWLYGLNYQTICMKVNPGDVVELGGTNGFESSAGTRYCVLKSLPDNCFTQLNNTPLSGCFPAGVTESLTLVYEYEKRIVESDGHYLLVQNNIASGRGPVGYIFVNGQDVLHGTVNSNKRDSLNEIYALQDTVGYKESIPCSLTQGETYIGILNIPIKTGQSLKISIVDSGSILTSSQSNQSIRLLSSAFATINSASPFQETTVTTTNDSMAIYLRVASDVISANGSIIVNLEVSVPLNIPKFGKINRPIITVIDDDTPGIPAIEKFRNACNAKGIKGTFASLTNTWIRKYKIVHSESSVGVIANGAKYNYVDSSGVTREWTFLYKDSGGTVLVFAADYINEQFPPTFSGTLTKVESSGDATIDTIHYSSYTVDKGLNEVLKEYNREGHQTVVHAYAQRNYFMTQKKIVFAVDSQHPLTTDPNTVSEYSYTNGGYTGTLTCYEVSEIEGTKYLTFAWMGANVSHEPASSGTLTKVSGTGDTTIYYSSFEIGRFFDAALVEDNMIHAMQDFAARGFVNYDYWVTPYGAYSDDYTSIARRCGLQCIVSIGSLTPVTKDGARGRYNLPRLGLNKGDSGTSLANVKAAIDLAVANNDWVIVGTHLGTDGWTQQDIESVFYEFVEYAKTKGMSFVTLGEGLTEWMPVFNYYEMFDV